MSSFSLTGKRLLAQYGPHALVTGASSGLGAALAELLAEAGFALVLHGRDRNRLEALAERLRQQHGTRTQLVTADLAEAEGVGEVLEAVRNTPIGLVVLSAGFGTSGRFAASNLVTEVNLLRVNVEAVLRLSHYFARQMEAAGRGGIILLSSLVGFQGVPHAAHYAATKAYVQSLAEGIGAELAPRGVEVLAAAPGPVATGFAARAGLTMGQAMDPAVLAPEILKALGRRRTVLPGGLTKILMGALRTVPRWARVRIMAQVMKGMVNPPTG